PPRHASRRSTPSNLESKRHRGRESASALLRLALAVPFQRAPAGRVVEAAGTPRPDPEHQQASRNPRNKTNHRPCLPKTLAARHTRALAARSNVLPSRRACPRATPNSRQSTDTGALAAGALPPIAEPEVRCSLALRSRSAAQIRRVD